MNAEQLAVVEKLLASPRKGVRGPFAALLRNPALAEQVMHIGDSIRFENSLPDVLREMTILMVARFWSAKYEWHAHGKIAKELGFTQDKIDALGINQRPTGMSQDESLIYDFISELLQFKDISDETFEAAQNRFGEKTVIDLLGTAAYFGFVSLILNAVRMPVPDGGAVLPALK
jgi:4-carboxymuconolactone decarboxylase